VSRPPEKIRSTATADPRIITMSVPRTRITTQYATRDTENIPSNPKQVGELSTATHPPMVWFGSLEILLRKLEEFIKFVNGCHCLLLKVPCKILLRRIRRG